MKLKKIFLTILIVFTFSFVSGIALADDLHSHESEIEEGKKLVDNKVSCEQLTDDQLEAIGEYLMEQMHPGEAHEMMDKIMGGEGSESLKQAHIQMAKRLYCNEDVNGMMGGGLMNMMMGNNMMGSGMMSEASNSGANNLMNMMGWGAGLGWGWFGWIFMILFWVLVIIGIVGLIKWLFDPTKAGDKSKTALNILEKRYAKGEIDKKEFEEKKKDLI